MRRNLGAHTQGLRGQHINVHHVNDGAKTIAYHRWDGSGPGDDVVVFAASAWRSYPTIGSGSPSRAGGTCASTATPPSTTLRSAITPQRGVQGGRDPYDGMPYSIDLSVGPYTALVFSQ